MKLVYCFDYIWVNLAKGNIICRPQREPWLLTTDYSLFCFITNSHYSQFIPRQFIYHVNIIGNSVMNFSLFIILFIIKRWVKVSNLYSTCPWIYFPSADEYCRNPCLLVGQPLYDFRPPGVNTDGTGCWDYNTADESIILRCVSGTCQVQTGQISLCRFTGFVSLRRWVRGALCAAKWRYQWPRIHLVHDFGPLSQMEARNTPLTSCMVL